MEAAQADSRPDCRQEQPQAKPEPPQQQQSLSYFLFPPLLVMGCGWQQGQHKRGYVLEKRGGRFRVELQLPTVLRCMPDLASLAVAGHPTRFLSACMLLRRSLHGPLQQQRGQAHSMRAASGSLPVGHHRMSWPCRCAGPHRHTYKVDLTRLHLSELPICSLATLHHLHTWQCLRPHHEVNAATWPVMSQHVGGTTASKVLRSGQLLRCLHTLPSDESTGQHACRCRRGRMHPRSPLPRSGQLLSASSNCIARLAELPWMCLLRRASFPRLSTRVQVLPMTSWYLQPETKTKASLQVMPLELGCRTEWTGTE